MDDIVIPAIEQIATMSIERCRHDRAVMFSFELAAPCRRRLPLDTASDRCLSLLAGSCIPLVTAFLRLGGKVLPQVLCIAHRTEIRGSVMGSAQQAQARSPQQRVRSLPG
jgi:hypothetical protein